MPAGATTADLEYQSVPVAITQDTPSGRVIRIVQVLPVAVVQTSIRPV
jgi:hypothetical protein